MIWLAWRSNRAPLLISLITIAILITATSTAGAYVPRYPQMSWSFPRMCSRWNDVGPCRPETALTLSTLGALLLPLLLGMFVGVPTFSRDVDSRTHVSALTQSRSRLRWYFAPVIVVFLPISAAMTCLGLALHWATGRSRDSSSADHGPSVGFSWFDFPHFETAGVALGAYTLLMLIVGSTLALVFRRGIVSMLATLVVFLFFAPVAFTWIAREHYGSPSIDSEPISGLYRESEYPPNPYYTTDGTWVVDAGYVDSSGAEVRPDTARCAQPYRDGNPPAGETNEERSERTRLETVDRAARFDDCLRDQGVARFDIRYFAEDKFWRFQAIETGLMLAFGLAVSGAGISAVRRLT